MKKVSFDFDQTLSEHDYIVRFARELIEKGVEVWVVTSRYPCGLSPFAPLWKNDDLFEITDDLGIPRERIVFTSWCWKHTFFSENKDFVWHLDDFDEEVIGINEFTPHVKGIHCETSNWKEECEKLLL